MSSSFCNSDCQTNGCKRKTHSDEARYVWTITDFNVHEARGKALFSPPFPSVKNNQVKWCLELQPNGDTDAKDYIGLSLFLSKLSSLEKNKKIFAEAIFLVLDNENKETLEQFVVIREYPHPDIEDSGWGIDDFIEKDRYFRDELLLNNTLTIRCEVKFSDIRSFCGSGIKLPECDLSENYAALIKNQMLTDVVLSVNGKDYPAHKAVLAARSPVFCAMFSHHLKENELNRVDIVDINEAVVEEMLKYIYTGKCEVSDELVEGLLAAADKYDLGRLKIMCAQKLIEGLSVENATNVVILADMHHHEDLKREAIKFVVANFAKVLNTAGWQNRLSSNPRLVTEVCQEVSLLL
ncbi:speckle-type POZ protein B-like isoform X22 [Planococcus citri]|uniref:speckle-type POZ protein B-like isoform X22 n=1 Tax=Planococcus citri TaxID=170843 RepID=UPI0031F95FAB